MFTGIIRYQGKVEELDLSEHGAKVRISSPELVSNIQVGSSVSVNGVCLTATSVNDQNFSADLMPQTLRLSSLGEYQVGDSVNLEPSLRVGDEVGGHFVYGHVDAVGEILSIKQEGDATLISIWYPAGLVKYFAPQGSVAVDGVSLTLAEVRESDFTVSLIEETMHLTNLSDRQVGDKVNIEADMMIKYLDQLYGRK